MSVSSNIIISVGCIFCYLDFIFIIVRGKNIANFVSSKVDAAINFSLASIMLAILILNNFFRGTNDILLAILTVILVILMIMYIIKSNFKGKHKKTKQNDKGR